VLEAAVLEVALLEVALLEATPLEWSLNSFARRLEEHQSLYIGFRRSRKSSSQKERVQALVQTPSGSLGTPLDCGLTSALQL